CRRRRDRGERSPSRASRPRSRSRAAERRRGGSCWCRGRALPDWSDRRQLSRRESSLAGGQATEHTGAERIDLLECAAFDIRVARRITALDGGDDGLVEVAGRQDHLVVAGAGGG